MQHPQILHRDFRTRALELARNETDHYHLRHRECCRPQHLAVTRQNHTHLRLTDSQQRPHSDTWRKACVCGCMSAWSSLLGVRGVRGVRGAVCGPDSSIIPPTSVRVVYKVHPHLSQADSALWVESAGVWREQTKEKERYAGPDFGFLSTPPRSATPASIPSPTSQYFPSVTGSFPEPVLLGTLWRRFRIRLPKTGS